MVMLWLQRRLILMIKIKKKEDTHTSDITDLPEEKMRGKIHIVIRSYVKKIKFILENENTITNFG